MKKILFFVFGLALVFANANEKKEMVLGMSADYPPYEFVNDKNEIDGFEVELIGLIGEKVGVKFTPKNINFDGLIVALKAGKIDAIMSSMSATTERKKSVDFSDAYFVENNIWIKRKDSNLENKDQLIGKKIAAQLGTLQEAAARGIKDAKVVPTENVLAAVMQLKAGRIDAVVTDFATGKNFLKQNDDIAGFLVEPDGSDGLAIAFDKDKHTALIAKVNAAIAELKADGSIDKLVKKYDLK